MKKILLCFKNELLRKEIAGFLQAYGYDVDAEDPQGDFSRQVSAAPYDLVVLNALSEPASGYELYGDLQNPKEGQWRVPAFLMIAPEPPEIPRFKYLRENGIFFLPTYSSSEHWLEKLKDIFHLQR